MEDELPVEVPLRVKRKRYRKRKLRKARKRGTIEDDKIFEAIYPKQENEYYIHKPTPIFKTLRHKHAYNKQRTLNYSRAFVDCKENTKEYKDAVRTKELKKATKLSKNLEDKKIKINGKKNPTKKRKCDFDLWADEKDDTNEWIVDIIPKPFKVPKSIANKATLPQIPDVEVAAPGFSYNPSPSDHDEVIKKAYEEVVKLQKEELKLEKILYPQKFKRKVRANKKRKRIALKNDKVNIASDATSSAASSTASTSATSSSSSSSSSVPTASSTASKSAEIVSKAKRHNRWSTKFSKAKRNKMKREKWKRQQALRRIKMKYVNKEYKELPNTAKALDFKLRIKQINDRMRNKRRKRIEKTKSRQIGKFHFSDVAVLENIMFKKELPDCLRRLTPKSTMIFERFKHFQKRNIIANYRPERLGRRQYEMPRFKLFTKYDFSNWNFNYKQLPPGAAQPKK